MFIMVIPALIGAGAGIFSGIGNLFRAKKQRQHARSMYDLQRRHALEDWQRVNQYNSPEEQRKRLEAAGLNPALMYGSGAGAASGTAGDVRPSQMAPGEFSSPDFTGIANTALDLLLKNHNIDQQKAVTDNLKKDNTVKDVQMALMKTQALSTKTGEEAARWNLNFEKSMMETSADARREGVRQMRTTTDLAISRDEREAALAQRNIKESVERVLTMRLQRTKTIQEKKMIQENIRAVRKSTALKQIDIDLADQGIHKGLPIYETLMLKYLDLFLSKNPGGIMSNIMSMFPSSRKPKNVPFSKLGKFPIK